MTRPKHERKQDMSEEQQDMSETLNVTQARLAAAFTEWDRRYREEPDRFQNEASRLLKDTPENYGEACAPYLIALLNGSV